RGGLFAVGPVHSRRYATGQSAQQHQLAAVVRRVKQQLAPKQVADRPRRLVGVWNGPIQVGRLEMTKPRDGFLVNDAKCRCERFDASGTLDVRRLDVELEPALRDPYGHVRVNLREMPRELA